MEIKSQVKFNSKSNCIVLLTLVCIGVFSNCRKKVLEEKSNADQLIGTWIVQEIPKSKIIEKQNDSLPIIEKNLNYHFLKIYEDSTFTTNIFPEFLYGKVTADQVNIKLLPVNTKEVIILNLNQVLKESYVLNNFYYKQWKYNNLPLKYHNIHYNKKEFDPYTLQNNQWRINATKPESDSLIKVRMSNHMDFWIASLKTYDALNIMSFDYESFNTPFKLYSTAIELVNFDKWPKSFIDLFYDDNDARKAFKLTQSALYKSSTIHEENSYLLGIYLFSQIQKNL